MKSCGLYITECICFPRSGHHLLANILREYFSSQPYGDAFHYCELYLEPDKHIGKNPLTNFQKNHDTEGTTPIRGDLHYLVQIRNPIDAFASRWEMALRTGPLLNVEEHWRKGMKEWLEAWGKFLTKWVIDDVPNRLVVTYESLCSTPMSTIGHVIQFLRGHPNVDDKALAEAIAKFQPKPRRTTPGLPFCVTA